MEEPTNNCVYWRVESFGFFFHSPCKLKHFPESWWGRKPCFSSQDADSAGRVGFLFTEVFGAGWEIGWLLSQGPIFSFACTSGSCLYSLPWKLRQKRTLAILPLSECWKLGFMRSWLWTKLPLLLHMWNLFLLAKAFKEKSVYFVLFPSLSPVPFF